jgi:glycosyltransferase involved in cell wall biosynthesis
MENCLFFLSNIDFLSETGAAYTRVMNYSRALSSKNIKIVITSSLNKVEGDNTLLTSDIPNVFYSGKPDSRVKKNFKYVYLDNLFFLSYFKYVKRIYYEANLKERNNVFILYPGSLALVIVTLLYLKIFKRQVVIIESNELISGIALNFPIYGHLLKRIILLFIKLFLLFCNSLQDALTPMFSGIIVISTKLEKLFDRFNNNIIRIPILSKIENHSFNKYRKDNEFKIGYTGNINEAKDGIFSFFKVLTEVETNRNVTFHLWGVVRNSNQSIRLNEKLKKMKLDNRVFVHERVKYHQLNGLIMNFDLLVLPRPKNLQTNYGFSTKLGEYMMSGIPVLVTNVSDNGLYISDNKNGFIVKAGKGELLRKKLEEILVTETGKLHEIGLEGRNTALKYFDNMQYSDTLFNFLFTSKSRKETL